MRTLYDLVDIVVNNNDIVTFKVTRNDSVKCLDYDSELEEMNIDPTLVSFTIHKKYPYLVDVEYKYRASYNADVKTLGSLYNELIKVCCRADICFIENLDGTRDAIEQSSTRYSKYQTNLGSKHKVVIKVKPNGTLDVIVDNAKYPSCLIFLSVKDVIKWFEEIGYTLIDKVLKPSDIIVLNFEVLDKCNSDLVLVNQLIEVFELFLDDKSIEIHNDEKDEAIEDGEEPDYIANIYGTDYGDLEDSIKNVLKKFGKLDN